MAPSTLSDPLTFLPCEARRPDARSVDAVRPPHQAVALYANR